MSLSNKKTAHSSSAPKNASVPPSLIDVIDRVIEAGKAEDVLLRDVIEAVGDTSFAPILLLPALALATPLSGIPFFSTVMGVVICLVSLQMLIKRENLWLPRWVLRRHVKGRIVRKAFTYVMPVAKWLDERTEKRFRLLVRRPLVFIPQIVCAISGAITPILEFIPFSSSMAGIGVAFLALGMLARDGLVILLGLIPYGVLSYLISAALT